MGMRPTLYCPEILDKTRDYLQNFEAYGDLMPSNAGLACHLGITRETVQAWRRDEEKAEFSYILAEIQATQERVLFNKGLGNVYNANICKLALGKHGYSDKHETELSGPGGGPLENKWSVEIKNADNPNT
jgi:hypothetical protein